MIRFLPAAALVYAALCAIAYFLGLYPRHRTETAWLIAGGLFLLLNIPRLVRTPRFDDPPVIAKRGALIPVGFVIGAFVLFALSLNVGLLSDDFVLLAQARQWQIVPAGWEHLRPIPIAIWAALSAIALGPFAFHAVNIALHGFNSFLTYRLGAALGFSTESSAWAGVLFLVFPGAVETVTWISGLQDVLMTTLVMTFLLTALGGRWLYAALALVAALFTKETAVAAPVLLALLALLTRRVSLRLVGAAFAAAAGFAALRLATHAGGDVFAMPTRYFLKEFGARLFGGLSLAWTSGQLTHAPWIGVVTVLCLAALFAGPIVRRIDARPPFAFIGWAIAAAAPVSIYFYVTSDLQGSRYLYLPAVGWSLFVSWLAAIGAQRQLARVAVAVLVLLGAAGSVTQQRRWQSAAMLRDEVLASARAVAASRGCARPAFENAPDNLDGAYVFRNGFNEAFEPAATGTTTCVLRWQDGAFVERK